MSRRVTIAAIIATAATSTGLSQAIADPTGVTASTNLSRQVASLSHRLERDEGAIRALQSRHLSVVVRTSGVYGGNPALNDDFGQVLCNTGETIVGGGAGWGVGTGLDGDHLTYSQPITRPPGWIAGGVHDPSETQPFDVYALCAH